MARAGLSKRLCMVPRELPAYLAIGFAKRYPPDKQRESMVQKIVKRTFRALKFLHEFTTYLPEEPSFQRNIRRLDHDFALLNQRLSLGNRSICAYFVGSEEHNGGVVGDRLYPYHLYKVRKFQKHFDVAAKVVRSADEIFQELARLKQEFPNRPIEVVNIMAHGGADKICIPIRGGERTFYSTRHVKKNSFASCSNNAAIILDSCNTGKEINSIAAIIAFMNPGKTVFAPRQGLWFSKPIFKQQGDQMVLDHVVHGPSLLSARTMTKFRYLKSNQKTPYMPM